MSSPVSIGVLGAVGGTPLIELRKVVAPGSARVLAKLEWANPTGSMKDRMAVAVIAAAEARGDLAAGDTVVEYTAGTTGISLAFVCAAKGYRFHAVFSDAFSHEKRATMEAFGATVEDVPSDRARITEQLIKAMIARAGELSKQPGHWWCDQLNNRDAISSRTGVSTLSCRRSAPLTPFTAQRAPFARITRRLRSSPSSQLSLPSFRVSQPARIGSRESGLALSHLSGNRTRLTRSSRSELRRRWR